jgi:hypothetical protein
MKELYYVYISDDGTIGRVAKRGADRLYYGWDNGKWIEMPGLIKIEFDITNYREISKEEAERIIKEQDKETKEDA